MNQQTNMCCPKCNQHSVEKITKLDPLSFTYNEITKYVCTFCGTVVEPSEQTTYSNSTDSSYVLANSVGRYCDKCHTKLEYNGTWWECPNCHYGFMESIGDTPTTIQLSEEDIELSKELFEGNLFVPCDNTWSVGTLKEPDDVERNTLTITNCEKIRMHHKEMDIDFEFDTKKLENIDTIIINGYKFVRSE